MKLFTWIDGRQPCCPYWKFCFYSFKLLNFGFDCYLLKFDPLGTLLIHTDKIDSGKHYRVNIKLWGRYDLKILRKHINLFGIIIIFRPDIHPHGLMVFKKSYILSFGVAKYDKEIIC